MAKIASAPSKLRLLDTVYIGFLCSILPMMIAIDLQDLYPKHLVPDVFVAFKNLYISSTGDPILGRLLGGEIQMAWFDGLAYLEAVFYLPAVFGIIYGLYNGYQSTYVLLLAFASSTITTLVACMNTIHTIPTSALAQASPKAHAAAGEVLPLTISANNKLLLESMFLVFFGLCLTMTVDSALKLASMARSFERGQMKKKTK